MRVTHLTGHGTRNATRNGTRNGATARRTLFSTLTVAALLTVTAGAAAEVGPVAASPSTSGHATANEQPATDGDAAATTDVAPGSYRITLLTGDVVTLHVAADGRQAASLEEAPRDGSGRDPQIFERDGQVHVVPAEVSPYLASGALDERLFNITSLVEQGLHDDAVDELPLVVSGRDGPSTFSTPEGARVERDLPSIDAVSLAAEKSAARAVWTSLRGTAPRADSGETDQPQQAELTGATTVWLNGKVEAALDESVPQVGAPQAWEAGFDGTGVPVAVLDSGYDADHPDLRGKVIEAENFSPEEDPAGETAVDRNGHGTHVAATIAGTGAASDGRLKGVAPGADLLIGKVLDAEGSGYEDEIIAGMEWAVDEGARVVNMSLGTAFASDGTDPLSVAVNRLSEASGALFVVAAGNTGPAEQTVGSPGAADEALTVGAVDKSDQPAWFSSRGPRIGDGAIKPEIVAPGVGIVAARAAGTSLGNLIDEHYTSMNGTSMATPHVAGAAAILAQRHDEWDADELKARLVSSSVPLDGESISFQGAGRLDVPAALDDSVAVSSGSLYLGEVQHDADAVTATLAYHNPTERRVTLRLSAEVGRSGHDGGKPVLRLSRPTLSIPAGATASTTVRMSPRGAEAGDYTGHIVGVDARDRTAVVSTVTSFSIVPPSHTVTVDAVDRNGEPARGPVEFFNTDTWEEYRAFFNDGAATFDVPEGEYTVMTAIDTPADEDDPAAVTVAGDPEMVVDGDVALTYDARDGEPVQVDTPRDVMMNNVNVVWRRAMGDASVTSMLASAANGDELFMMPSDEAGAGEFDVWTTWQLDEPLMTLDVAGDDSGPIERAPRLATAPNPYVGETELPMVYAGRGTPEEFADVDAEGRVAIVARPADGDVRAQAEAARAAGAELLLVHNDRPGSWVTGIWGGTFPTYTIEQDVARTLRAALEDDPDARVAVTAIHDSTYAYQLAFGESGRIPAGMTYDVADQPIATVEADYREDSPTQGRRELWIPYVDGALLGTSLGRARNGPVVRTEYVSAGDVEWQRFGFPHGEFANMYWTSSAVEPYEPGETYQQEWWGPLVRPAVPALEGDEELGLPVARFHDAIRIAMPHYSYGNWSLNGTIYNQMGDVSEMTLHRDGELIGSSPWPEAQYTVSAEDAAYELRLTVDNGAGNWRETSVATDTTWRFRSERTDDARTVLPLVQANYELAAGSRNEMPVGESYPLVIEPEYQPEATGPGGFEASVQVSFDDGATWTDAAVEPAGDGRVTASVPAHGEPGFATVRVTVTDADGNGMTQRIDRAWRISGS